MFGFFIVVVVGFHDAQSRIDLTPKSNHIKWGCCPVTAAKKKASILNIYILKRKHKSLIQRLEDKPVRAKRDEFPDHFNVFSL